MRLEQQDIEDIRAAIRDEGMACLWVKDTLTLIDPAKPWLGSTAQPTEKPCTIAFVDMATAAALVTQWRPDADIGSSVLFGLMGNEPGLEPKIGERVLREGREDLIVKDVTEAAPAGVALFYVLEFQA